MHYIYSQQVRDHILRAEWLSKYNPQHGGKQPHCVDQVLSNQIFFITVDYFTYVMALCPKPGYKNFIIFIIVNERLSANLEINLTFTISISLRCCSQVIAEINRVYQWVLECSNLILHFHKVGGLPRDKS